MGNVRGASTNFALGEHDTPDRLLIPEKLYGRAREIDTLLASFDRIVESGTPELVLVSGYSGIGKSSVVNELHKSAGSAARPLRIRQVRPVQARHPLCDAGAGFSEPCPTASRQERGRVGELARRPAGGARPERTAHGRPRPRTEAHHRRTAAGS